MDICTLFRGWSFQVLRAEQLSHKSLLLRIKLRSERNYSYPFVQLLYRPLHLRDWYIFTLSLIFFFPCPLCELDVWKVRVYQLVPTFCFIAPCLLCAIWRHFIGYTLVTSERCSTELLSHRLLLFFLLRVTVDDVRFL